MRVIALVQARLGSIRLPKKVLKNIAEKPLIEILLERLSKSHEIDEIIVASSDKEENDQLQILIESLGYKCSRGSENDVLNRFYAAAQEFNADAIVRITGDCPLVDATIVDECIKQYKN